MSFILALLKKIEGPIVLTLSVNILLYLKFINKKS